MSTSEFEKLLAQARMLNADEQRQLRDALSRSVQGDHLSEDEFEQMLVSAGILAPLVPRKHYVPWTAIAIAGEPLSETIVQERR